LLGILWFFGHRYQRAYYESLFWTWDNGADGIEMERDRIDTDDIWFPPDFIFGVSTSAHQIEGNARNSNWSRWEQLDELEAQSENQKQQQQQQQKGTQQSQPPTTQQQEPNPSPSSSAAPSENAPPTDSSKETTALLPAPSAEPRRRSLSLSKATQQRIRKKPRIYGGQKSGPACDHWNRVHQDIGLMREIGVNGYRFSLDWAKLQPAPGAPLDKEALEHYRMEVDALLEAGITPMITLHHFTHPLWFEEMGSFEKRENIEHFVNFCKLVFEEFSPKVKLWITIHEPFFFVFNGWINGIFPPGKQNPQLAGYVLANLLEAHVRVYAALKEMKHGPSCKIGLAKDYYIFDCWAPCNPLDQLAVIGLEVLFNSAFLDFFRMGEYVYRYVGTMPVRYYDERGPKSLDFIGLNYYSHSLVRFRFSTTNPVEIMHMPGVIHTDAANAPIYAEGLYRALKKLSSLGVPIYVTENGCADATDDRRHLYLRRHLYALSKALREGCDVRGYFYWTLMDSFEWNEGYSKKYGLYHVDHTTQQRTLREGARYYQRVIERFIPNKRPAPRPIPRSLSSSSFASVSSAASADEQQQQQQHHTERKQQAQPTSPLIRASPTFLSRERKSNGNGSSGNDGSESPVLLPAPGSSALAKMLAGRSTVSSLPRSRSGTKLATLLNLDTLRAQQHQHQQQHSISGGSTTSASSAASTPASSVPSTPKAADAATASS